MALTQKTLLQHLSTALWWFDVLVTDLENHIDIHEEFIGFADDDSGKSVYRERSHADRFFYVYMMLAEQLQDVIDLLNATGRRKFKRRDGISVSVRDTGIMDFEFLGEGPAC